jgi:tetratricopeptide (TPR) repeat protein
LARARKSPASPPPPAGPTTNDPVELAMEAEASGAAGPDSPARRVLVKSEKLIGWQIASERAGFALKVLTAVAGLLAAVAIGWLILDASRYQGLVVQAFSAPPDMAARGLTGEVIAGKLLDDLVRMQTRTESVRAAGSYAIDWGDKIEVQIPQTGVSIGDLQRVLRQQFGRETRISGVVYRLPDGQLSVTARTGGAAGQTFVGPEAEFDGLVQKAAESVYGQTQPYRYSVYLKTSGRTEEAVKVLAAFQGRKDVEAAWALRGWAYIDMDADRFPLARRKMLEALKIAPDMAAFHYTLHQTEAGLGHTDAALRSLRRAKALFRSGASKEVTPDGVATMVYVMDLQEAALTADYRRLAGLEKPSQSFGLGQTSWAVDKAIAWGPAHEPEKVARLLAVAPAWNDDNPIHRFEDARRAYASGASHAAAGDWAAAAADYEATRAILQTLPQTTQGRYFILPVLAEAWARTGRVAEARALVADLPLDCDDCLIARATVEALAGERALSDRLFVRAQIQAQSSPFARVAWGRARLARGDAAGALDLFRQAKKLAPQWADPLKLEGDAEMALRRPGRAAEAYARAARLAPRWGALHLAWSRALSADGRAAEAAEKLRLARGMVLSPADRAAAD